MSRVIAVDTETTGVDLRHTSRPFFVTIADEHGDVSFWEWDVDPKTREVDVPRGDVAEIRRIIGKADTVVMHNSKFDVRALETIGVFVDWSKVVDTLLAGHLLASNQPHDLTYMVMHYLGVSIKGLEEDLARCTKKARLQAKRLHWAIAKEGMEGMPSVSGGSSRDADKPWRNDTWLPRALAQNNNLSDGHEYWTVLQDYANADSLSTIKLWNVLKAKIKSQGLEAIWKERLKLLPVVYNIETKGLTLSLERMRELQDRFTDTLESTERICQGIARSYLYDLELPKGNRNDSLQNFIYGKKGLNLDPIAKTETGKPSMAAKVLEQYLYILPDRSKHKKFIKCLTDRSKVATALNYLASYERFCLPCDAGDDWRVLYPSLNITGTHTLRFSSYNPNSQNSCVDGDTEVLTEEGWVKFKEYKEGTKVAQFWKEDGSIDFVYPTEVHKSRYKGSMLHIQTEQQIDMLLTPNHRCLTQDRKTHKFKDKRADEFPKDSRHLHAGDYIGGNLDLTKEEITWLCAVQADGSYHVVDGKFYGVKFVFSKPRKVERLLKCLARSPGVRYKVTTKKSLRRTFGQSRVSNTTSIFVYSGSALVHLAKSLMPAKTFDRWILDLSRKSLKMFCSEIHKWDGDSTREKIYSSSVKKNIDWVQIAFTLTNGRSFYYSKTPKTGVRSKEHYYLNITTRKPYSMTTNHTTNKVPWDDYVYCLTVPSSYIIIRRNGRVSITGNSKREGFNLRYAFGPKPGREWWSIDASNIELRLPAYEAGEEEMIALFERPDDPPYFGSNHLLVSHILHPKEFEECVDENGKLDGRIFKKRYASTLYQWVKNGNFAVQYGAIPESGTADRAYHVAGGQVKIQARFKKIKQLNDRMIAFAEKYGYVETIPDKTVDPKRGYPVFCTRTQWGKVLPTVPLNYHIQSTAMWWMMKAMNRCHQFFVDNDLIESHYIVAQIHDELIFDFPSGSEVNKDEPWRMNLPIIAEIRRLMMQGGDDIGIPTPVNIEYHKVHWSEGMSIPSSLFDKKGV